MFVVVEKFDDGRIVNHLWNARDLGTFLMYLKPGLWLSKFKKRGVKHRFTILNAIVEVERV